MADVFPLRHLALVLDALIGLVEGGPQAPRVERVVHDLRRQAARLHTGALMIQGRLGTGAPDRGVAATVQRRVAPAVGD
ncbi:hypothetical protein [Streptomyces mexicanus]|uniref:hypothetical protein n=1 Tax=Streptomyces mexicanus TaxID=178566 RepID=UPI0036595EED